jgi:hypothetical protein
MASKLKPFKEGTKSRVRARADWLLLSYQLPLKPAYLRVKAWRRLQVLGAIHFQNAMYLLPNRPALAEELQSLIRDIERSGGHGAVFQAGPTQGLTDAGLRDLFDAARHQEYEALAKELRSLVQIAKRKKKPNEEPAVRLRKARQRYDDIGRRDFFRSAGRETVAHLVGELEHSLITRPSGTGPRRPASSDLTGKVWVTRQDVHIDRIACSWLIKRFIDPKARFKFVADKKYAGGPGELRFDMFNGEFTHEGDKCSFEVLLLRAGIVDSALAAIAEIVHDIDINDGKFGRPETQGIAHMIDGICLTQKDDEGRIRQASTSLDGVYEKFRR